MPDPRTELRAAAASTDLFGDTRVPARIWSKLERDDQDPDSCWRWTAWTSKGGYANTSFERRNWAVHRLVYSMLVAPIPDGLQIDHLCRNPPCCNPAHLEPVTQTVNLKRQAAARTTCPQGHPFEGDNLYLYPTSGMRRCVICQREASARARRRSAAKSTSRRIHRTLTDWSDELRPDEVAALKRADEVLHRLSVLRPEVVPFQVRRTS